MNDEINMKKKKKSLVRFWIILICSMIVGGSIGFGCNYLISNANLPLESFRDFLIWCSPYLMIVVNLVSYLITFVLMKKCNELMQKWDQEDDSVYEQMEKKSGIAIGISSVNCIFSMICFGLGTAGFGAANTEISISSLGFCILFIILILGNGFIQRKEVEFVKKVNPEMKGDALDTDFQKTWLENCDEFQRQKIYKSAYETYIFSNKIFPMILVILIIGQIYFSFGIVPILAVGIIWMMQTVVYVKSSLKTEKLSR